MGFLDSLAGGITGLGDVFGGVLEFGNELLGGAAPIFETLGQFGVIGPGQSGGPMTNPSPGALQQQASMLPAVLPAARGIGSIFTGPAARGVLGTGLVAEGIDLFQDLLGGNGGNGQMANSLMINPVVGNTPRYPRTVQQLVQTPSGNTRVVTYRNMGSPILYSGDLAAKKRVNRVKRRLGR